MCFYFGRSFGLIASQTNTLPSQKIILYRLRASRNNSSERWRLRSFRSLQNSRTHFSHRKLLHFIHGKSFYIGLVSLRVKQINSSYRGKPTKKRHLKEVPLYYILSISFEQFNEKLLPLHDDFFSVPIFIIKSETYCYVALLQLINILIKFPGLISVHYKFKSKLMFSKLLYSYFASFTISLLLDLFCILPLCSSGFIWTVLQ